MAKLYNLARMTSATTGTGILTLGTAATVGGVLFLTFDQAGVQDGQTVSYSILDPSGASEATRGVYTASGATLTRLATPLASSNGGALINCSGNQQIAITALDEDFPRSGTALLDFGVWPGSSTASLAITGQEQILSGSVPQCQVSPLVTSDHTVDEHVIDAPQVCAGNIVPGTGFTIYGQAAGGGTPILFGKYNISWSWARDVY